MDYEKKSVLFFTFYQTFVKLQGARSLLEEYKQKVLESKQMITFNFRFLHFLLINHHLHDKLSPHAMQS